MTTTKNKFAQALISGRQVVTAECIPPRNGGVEAVKKLSSALAPNLDAVVVADNPDEIHGSALVCAGLLTGEGRDTVLTMTTRDRNRIALESDALGASTLGVSAILCLSGNHQSLGVCPQAAAVNDIDSLQFTQAVKALDLPELLLGATAHPYQQPLVLSLLRLKKKIAAGADFVLTQPVFDLASFTRWMDAVREAGMDKQTAVIASVLPLKGVEQFDYLQQRQSYGSLDESIRDRLAGTSDPVKEGLTIAADVAAQAKAVPGVSGIHILCGGYETVAGELITAAALA